MCAAASVKGQQAAGRAAVLLLPASCLFASVDVLYLLPLRDKVRSRALEPASVRTPLMSVSTHSPTPPASHHLLTVVICCKLLQMLGDHCGTGIIGVGTLILDRRVHVLVLSICTHFSASRSCGSVKKNRAHFACNQRKCESQIENFLWRCAAARAAKKKCVFPMVEGDFPTPTFFREKNRMGALSRQTRVGYLPSVCP